jgi:hypothetical protein
MTVKECPVQTTVRIDRELLKEAQYYWSLEGMSLRTFVVQKVQEFLTDYREAHPERVPGGSPGKKASYTN